MSTSLDTFGNHVRTLHIPKLASQLMKSLRLIPKADRKKVHEYLFRGMSPLHRMPRKLCCSDEEVNCFYLEGVLVAKKDFNLPKHNEIDTKNLYVGGA